MAAKRVDPLKAKEARQKKIAAIGGVLLLALLAVQGPKTLKMLQGPQPVASSSSTAAPAAPTAPTPGTAAPATGGTATTPTPAADLASVADSDAAPAAEQGQLATFERFASKDPFVQQAQPVPAAPRTSDANDGSEKPKQPGDDAAGGAAGGFTGGGSGSGSGSSPTPPRQPELAEATSISVNGVPEDVALEGTFPKDQPTFVLVSIAADGKSVEIGIAGGEYATGGETMKLGLGRTITLQNTADGSRYELELLSIQGRPLPKTSKQTSG